MLDIVPKGGFRDILDLKINNESRFLFSCELYETMNSVILSNIPLDEINFNPNVKPTAYLPTPSSL